MQHAGVCTCHADLGHAVHRHQSAPEHCAGPSKLYPGAPALHQVLHIPMLTLHHAGRTGMYACVMAAAKMMPAVRKGLECMSLTKLKHLVSTTLGGT